MTIKNNLKMSAGLEISPCDWTAEQLAVIEAAPEARIIVDAGPGTGKTAVLSGRIAFLIDKCGVRPSDIWIISFTRTAVAELRKRVGAYLKNPSDLLSLRIATIDSHAWSLNSGFSESLQFGSNFEEPIEDVIKLVRSHEGVFEYLDRTKHIFVDEAQDVVGSRVELLLEIFLALNKYAGVTVLCDEAQGIYGFHEKNSKSRITGTLPENLREFFEDFACKELVQIHRTDDPQMRELFTEGRRILRSGYKPRLVLSRMRQLISRTSSGPVSHLSEEEVEIDDLNSFLKGKPDEFYLYRTRGDALHAAGSHHGSLRLRVSGFPTVLKGWLADVFWDWTEPEINQSEFMDRWVRRVPVQQGQSKEFAWADLISHFGVTSNIVSLRKMRQRLSSTSPPVDFCEKDYGFSGPLFGTIHTSKGREAEIVNLTLPSSNDGRASSDEALCEEARVLFVGATRAKKVLFVTESDVLSSNALKGSGRAFREVGNRLRHIRVEVGRNGDLLPYGLVGKSYFKTADDALLAQKKIHSLGKHIHEGALRRQETEEGWNYALQLNSTGSLNLAFINNKFRSDLNRIVKGFRKNRPSNIVEEIKYIGYGTSCVSNGSDLLEHLHYPWSESGFVRLPLVFGFSLIEVR